MKRKILKYLGWTLAVGCVLVLLALLTADLWSPSVIRPLLKEQGVTFDEIQRGEGTYTLTNVAYIDEGLSATIETLEAPALGRILWKWLFNAQLETRVLASNVSIKEMPVEKKATAIGESDPINIPALVESSLDYWSQLAELIDEVKIENVVYRDAAGERDPISKLLSHDTEGKIDRGWNLNLNNEQLIIEHNTSIYPTTSKEATVRLSIHRISNTRLSLETLLAFSPLDMIKLSANCDIADGFSINGDVSHFVRATKSYSTPLDFSAQWGTEGYIPELAAMETTNFILPSELYAVPDYQQPSISLYANWNGAEAEVSLNVSAAANDRELPPLKLELLANGDDKVINVGHLDVEAWSSKIVLAEPLRVELDNLKDLPDAHLTVDLNLSDFPDQALGGRLQGALIVDHQPGEGWPLVHAQFAGNSLTFEDFALQSLNIDAQLDYPMLTINALNASTGDGTTLMVDGSADIEEETIQAASVDLQANGAFIASLQPFTGDLGVTFDSLTLQGKVSGPIGSLQHEGALAVSGLHAAEGASLDVDFQWQGDWLALKRFSLGLANERSQIELGGQAALDYRTFSGTDQTAPRFDAEIQTASIAVRDQPKLVLQSPFSVSYQRGIALDDPFVVTREDGRPLTDPFNQTAESGVAIVNGMHFASDVGGHFMLSGRVNYPRAAELELSARDVSATWLGLLMDEPLPFSIELDELDLKAAWRDGPMTAKLRLDVDLQPDNQPLVEIRVDGEVDESGMRLTNLKTTQGDFTLMEAKGDAPLTITPAGERIWSLGEAPIDFALNAEPDDSPVWNQLEKLLEIDFIRPVISMDITGNVEAPEGRIQVQFDALESLGKSEDKQQWPRIEQADVSVKLTPDLIELSRATVLVTGQPLRVEGSAPMNEASWLALIEDGAPPDWRQAKGRLSFSDVPLNALRQWLPPVIRDEGSMSINAELKPGEQVTGSLDLDGVSTRPLDKLGALNNINAALRVSGRTLSIQQAEAMVGGAPLQVTGRVELNDDWKPLFDLKLQGENVPIARTPGIILRASPDVSLKTDDQGVTTVGGKVTLNESFFTMDLADLQQGGSGASAGNAANRPPYFSIREEPLSDWRLQLELEGDRFLRVRVPAFEGVVSAGFSLRGNLRNPRMFGQAVLDRGVVMFPFATLRLDEGSVSITQDNPDTPQVNVRASGRAYGYDLIMRLAGPAHDPVVSFTSTPSLEQSEILLMITSGQIPDHARSTESRLSGIGMYIGRSVLVDWGLIDPLDETLTVSIGEDITTSGKDTINIRYKVDEDIDVVGAYDEYDAYYLDVEWNLYRD